MMKIKNKNSGFSMIEVMIAIFIFAMAMASIFMVINSSISTNTLNKNQIIASNLAREQIEIIRNLRDNNYATYHKYNWIMNNSSNPYSSNNFLISGKYYKVENSFSDPNYNYKIQEINNFGEGKSELNGKMQNYRLYLDNNGYYTYNSSGKKTIFYRYLHIEVLKDSSGNTIKDALKITSKVIWYLKGYHKFEIKTILADFNRL